MSLRPKNRVIMDGIDLSAPDSSPTPNIARPARAIQPWDATLQIPVRMSDETINRLDEDEWAIPSYNKRGQSVRVTVKIFPEMEQVYKTIVERSGLPYTTIEDAFRHAIYRHLVWMDSIRRTNPPTAFVAARTILLAMQHEMLKDEIEDAVEPYAKRLLEYLDKGYIKSAIRLLDRMRSIVNELEIGPNRDKLETSIRINAGRVEKQVEDRRALFLAKQEERLADAALATEPADSTSYSEDHATEYPAPGTVDTDDEPDEPVEEPVEDLLIMESLRTAARHAQALDLASVRTINPPDEDDYYSPVDMVEPQEGD